MLRGGTGHRRQEKKKKLRGKKSAFKWKNELRRRGKWNVERTTEKFKIQESEELAK